MWWRNFRGRCRGDFFVIRAGVVVYVTENRYAGRMSQQPNAYGNPDVQLYQEPERTSVLAILSLVFGVLGCCGGVTSVLGIPMAIISMIGISKSKGRVGGMGLAVGGLIVGLLTLALWVGMVFGMGGMMKVAITQFGATTEAILTDVQNGDFDAARQNLASPGNQTTDDELIAFAAAYTTDLGQYVSMPDGFGDLVNGYMAVGPLIQPYQNRPGFVPMPAQFDTGWVLVIYIMDPNGQGPVGSNGMPLPEELILVGPDGTEYRIPPATSSGGSASADADSDAESATPDPDMAEEEDTEEPEEGP